MKKTKRIIAAILTVAAAVSVMTVSAAAVDLDVPAAKTVVSEIPSAAESTAAAAMTHAPEQVVVENVKDSGMFYNESVPTTVATTQETVTAQLSEERNPAAPTVAAANHDSVITGLVAAPIAAVVIAAIAGIISFSARSRKKKNQ